MMSIPGRGSRFSMPLHNTRSWIGWRYTSESDQAAYLVGRSGGAAVLPVSVRVSDTPSLAGALEGRATAWSSGDVKSVFPGPSGWALPLCRGRGMAAALVLAGDRSSPLSLTVLCQLGRVLTLPLENSELWRRISDRTQPERRIERSIAAPLPRSRPSDHGTSQLLEPKRFLQRLIDSAVDAIVAADRRGRVLLFNAGAERVYGYRAEEVIGRVPVWELYPDGVAREIMAKLRSPGQGGIGRLEQARQSVRAKSGELIPVSMTAAMIYESGSEVATFGIFTDLRERLRIEERLVETQKKLQTQERKAMMAQFAGAAAHELNQPLTSIMAYTSWMLRRTEVGASQSRPLRIIMEQAERMAKIVKTIGQMTRYDTIRYVGNTSIVDLDGGGHGSGTDEVPTVPGRGTPRRSPI